MFNQDAANGGTAEDDEQLWVVADVARYMRIPRSAVYRMTMKNAPLPLPHMRLGGRLRFRKSDIDRFLNTLLVSDIDLSSKLRAGAARIARGGTNGQHSSARIA